MDAIGHRPAQRSGDHPLSGPFSDEKPNSKITINTSATDVILKLKFPDKGTLCGTKANSQKERSLSGFIL